MRPPKSTRALCQLGPMDLVVAARVDEQRGARRERLARVVRRRGDRAALPQPAQPGHRQHEVVGQLVEGALDPEVRAEREREDDRVGSHVPARVVADEQHRTRRRGCCPSPRTSPRNQMLESSQNNGQLLPDEVGIALVEVGSGNLPLDHAGEPAPRAVHERRRSRRRAAGTVDRRVGHVSVAARGRCAVSALAMGRGVQAASTSAR